MPTTIAYDRSGHGPLLLAIHGITENRRFWDPVPLSERFDVIRVDLRGHGESPTKGPFDPDTSAEDIHHLLVDLDESTLPIVLGHSFGGVIATIYASRYPTRGVVIVDQSLDAHPLPPSVAETMREGDIDGFMQSFFAGVYGDLDPALAADLDRRRSIRRDVLVGNWSPLLDLDEAGLDDWLAKRTDLPPDVPYFSLHGNDPGQGYDHWLRKRIPTAVVERTPAKTHYPHLAQPREFTDRLQTFAAALP